MTKKMETILTELENSGASEAMAVAEFLRDVASNGELQERNKFLVACAEEIRDWAQFVVIKMR
jgi:hypothetical protein